MTGPGEPTYLESMEVPLTPDQKAFVRQAIASGRLRNETEAFQEAMALWERRERARERILLAVDEAEASLARGGRSRFGGAPRRAVGLSHALKRPHPMQ